MIPASEVVNVYRGSTTNLFFTFSKPNDTPYDLTHFDKAEIAIFERAHRHLPQSVHEATVNGNEISISFTPEESIEAFRYDYPKIEVRFYTDEINFLVYFVGDVNILTPHDVNGEVESNNLIVQGDTTVHVGLPDDNNVLSTAIIARNQVVTLKNEIDTLIGNGATGSFTTADSKTVTVENGIITSIN